VEKYPKLPELIQQAINDQIKQKDIPAMLLKKHQIQISSVTFLRPHDPSVILGLGQECSRALYSIIVS